MTLPTTELSAARAATMTREAAGSRGLPTWLLQPLVLATMILGALVILLVATLTLFRARRLYAEVLTARLARVILWQCGIRLRVHHRERAPERRQLVFVSNHTSTLDMFVLAALGLRRARFFLSGYLKKNPALGIVGGVLGIFWTVPQDLPDERRRIFARADDELRRTSDSVYLSPEGERVTTGRVGPFNKGAFHLATSLRAPIAPFFIRIPERSDPGRGVRVRPGTIDVFFGEPIETEDWRLEDLECNKERVHDLFARWNAELRR